MKIRFALLTLLLAMPILSTAQQQPTVTAQPNTIYVSANGKFETAPDTARIGFNISAQENTAKAAYDRASAAAEQVRQILRSNGIDPKQAEFGFLSLSPVYDYRNPKRKLIAYRVNSSVSLKLRDFSKVAPILQQLADSDITSDQTLNYSLEEMDAAKNRAVEDAYRHARAEAEALAKASGRTVGELSYGAIDTMEAMPIPMRAMSLRSGMAAEAAPAPTEQFTPEQITVTARVSAVFTLR